MNTPHYRADGPYCPLSQPDWPRYVRVVYPSQERVVIIDDPHGEALTAAQLERSLEWYRRYLDGLWRSMQVIE